MDFLKRLGSILLKGTQIALGVGPLVSSAFPSTSGAVVTVTNDLSAIGQVVVNAEAFGQALSLPGDQKLKAAIPAAAQVFLSSQMLHGRKVQDVARFNAAVATITGGVADMLKSLDDNIKTQDAA